MCQEDDMPGDPIIVISLVALFSLFF